MKQKDPLSLNTAISKHIAHTPLDRRIKLTPEQKEEVRRLYRDTDTTYRALAEEFGVSCSTIQVTIDPSQKRKTVYTGYNEYRATRNKEHRAYKLQLLKEGKL